MAVITLFSVAGAPGTTTTALAVALAWPRPVMLIDADPTASAPVLAGWLKGQQPTHAPSLTWSLPNGTARSPKHSRPPPCSSPTRPSASCPGSR